MSRKISILGAGTWGTALAIQLAANGHGVTLWSKVEKEIQALASDRSHIANLPDAMLPDEVELTTDLQKACKGKDIIVFAVASPYVRSVAKEVKPFLPTGQIIVNVAKGIEESSLMTLTEVISEENPGAEVAVLSGPRGGGGQQKHSDRHRRGREAEEDGAAYSGYVYEREFPYLYQSRRNRN